MQHSAIDFFPLYFLLLRFPLSLSFIFSTSLLRLLFIYLFWLIFLFVFFFFPVVSNTLINAPERWDGHAVTAF